MDSLKAGLSGGDLQQAQALWKMLDQMADSDPEQYKQFIKKNISQGMQQASREQKQKVQAAKIKVEPGLLLTCRMTSQFRDTRTELQQKLTLQKDKQVKPPAKEAKLNINLVHSPRVQTVVDKKGDEIKKLTVQGMGSWKTIPLSFCDLNSRLNDSSETVYYCVICVNSDLLAFVGHDMRRLTLLKDVIYDYVSRRLETDRNPCQGAWVYKLQRSTLQINRKKKYKFLKQKSPVPVLIEPAVDRTVLQKRAKAMQKQTQVILPSAVKEPQPATIKIPGTSAPAHPGKVFVQQVASPAPAPKAFVQELNASPGPKPSLIQQVPQKYFQDRLQEGQDGYVIVYEFSQPFQLKQIELDVAQQAVRLSIKGLSALTQLKRKICVEKAQAKKKGKVLRLSLPYKS